MPDRVAVSSADFIRNIGYWQGEALRHPISITHHGRERLVLATPDRFHPEAAESSGGKAEAALRADRAALIEGLDDGYLAFDAQLRVVASNAVAEAFAGVATEDFHGSTILESMPQPLASILHDRALRVLRSRKAERFEAGAFDGRRVEACVLPLSEGVAVIFHNTTELHALRRQLEEAQALDMAVAMHSHAASIRLDARARIEMVDDVFCRWLGFGATEVQGHRILDLISPPQRSEAGETIERVLREGLKGEMPLTLVAKRGAEMPGVLTLAPILTDCVAHGAQAIWSPTNGDLHETQRAA
jgi:PAS domain S-box-containing protein